MFDTKKFILNSKLSNFKKKIEETKTIVNKVMTQCYKPYIAWSGGKDSTALMYLITQDLGYKDILIFSQKDDCDFPDEKTYIENLTDLYHLNTEIVEPKESMWEYILKHKDLDNDIHKKTNEVTKIFFLKCIKQFIDKHNPDCVFMGLRNEESKARRINYYLKGDTYFTKYDESIMHCNPLSKWTATDVFSYMVTKHIPILPLYTKYNILKDAESLRKSWWIPTGEQIKRGWVLFIKKEYPELYRKLKAHFPEVASAC